MRTGANGVCLEGRDAHAMHGGRQHPGNAARCTAAASILGAQRAQKRGTGLGRVRRGVHIRTVAPKPGQRGGGLGGVPVDAGLVPRAGSGWNPRAVPYDRVAPGRRILGGRRVRIEDEKVGQNVCQNGPAHTLAEKITLAQPLSQVFCGAMQMQLGGCPSHVATARIVGAQRARLPRWGLGWGESCSVRGREYGGRGSGSGQVLPAPPLWLTGSTWRIHMHTVPFCPARAVWGR